MTKLIALMLLLNLCGCVTIKSGDTVYRRWWGEQQVGHLEIVYPDGTRIILDKQKSVSESPFELMGDMAKIAKKSMGIP